jgi:hypothetical protein
MKIELRYYSLLTLVVWVLGVAVGMIIMGTQPPKTTFPSITACEKKGGIYQIDENNGQYTGNCYYREMIEVIKN